MSEMTGMDIAEVRSLARQMSTDGDEMWSMLQQATSRIEAAPWVGNDQRRFVEQWHGHLSVLWTVVEALRVAADDASRYADLQEVVSNNG